MCFPAHKGLHQWCGLPLLSSLFQGGKEAATEGELAAAAAAAVDIAAAAAAAATTGRPAVSIGSTSCETQFGCCSVGLVAGINPDHWTESGEVPMSPKLTLLPLSFLALLNPSGLCLIDMSIDLNNDVELALQLLPVPAQAQAESLSLLFHAANSRCDSLALEGCRAVVSRVEQILGYCLNVKQSSTLYAQITPSSASSCVFEC